MTFSDLVGKTLVSALNDRDERIVFEDTEGKEYTLFHSQDCCESVSVEDIAGDLADLIGAPIVLAEESSNSDDPPKDGHDESWTWTFYRIGTAKGTVVIRWFGSSNGYYSERVTFA